VTRFNSVVLDVDSTLSGIEGIDWLAQLRGSEISAWSTALTDKAMRGEIPIEAVYGERMRVVRPALAEIEELGRVYVERVAPRARETLEALRKSGVQVVMVSGGLREAILPLAGKLGVPSTDLHAVSIFFNEAGEYSGFDESSPLTRQLGKKTVVGELALNKPTLAVGDGMTDCEMKAVVNSFAAYTGYTRRNSVIERADFVIDNFDQLRELVLQ
jgi:phosphoserine phosphatase